jgi:hypothetical protein
MPPEIDRRFICVPLLLAVLFDLAGVVELRAQFVDSDSVPPAVVPNHQFHHVRDGAVLALGGRATLPSDLARCER